MFFPDTGKRPHTLYCRYVQIKVFAGTVQNHAVAEGKEKEAAEEEKQRYDKAHKKKSWFMTLMREVVWGLGKWKTKALDRFIEEEAPDVYFVPIYPVVHIRTKFSIPGVAK